MAGAVYLADTSVFALQARQPRVADRYDALVTEGRLAACQMSALEYLNNAADPRRYDDLYRSLQSHRWMDITTDALDRALAVHRELGRRSQHRRFSLPDLIIAATAEQHGATVLHYDADYDRIAEIRPADRVGRRARHALRHSASPSAHRGRSSGMAFLGSLGLSVNVGGVAGGTVGGVPVGHRQTDRRQRLDLHVTGQRLMTQSYV